MLLLLVAFPLVVALPAAFDGHQVNALHLEVQSPRQFEVRSPPESRHHLPDATRDLHKSPATAPLRTHNTPIAHITNARAAALERGQDDLPRDVNRHQPLRAHGHQPSSTPHTRHAHSRHSLAPFPLSNACVPADPFAGRRAHAPQTSYYIDIIVSIAVALAAVATAVESSAAAILTSAVAATTLVGVTVTSSPTIPTQTVGVSLALGGDPKDRLLGSSIAIIAAIAVLAVILSCSRWISKPERRLMTGTNRSGGHPTLLRPPPKLSTAICLTTRLAQLVLVLLLCPGVMSTTPDSGPILIHEVGMLAGDQSLATEGAMREAKFHKAEAAAEDPFLFKHRLQYHDAASNKLTYFEYSARRHDHVLMLNEMNISSCALEVAGGQIQRVHLTSRDHDGLRMNVTAGTFLSHLLASVFIGSRLHWLPCSLFSDELHSIICRRHDICREDRLPGPRKPTLVWQAATRTGGHRS